MRKIALLTVAYALVCLACNNQPESETTDQIIEKVTANSPGINKGAGTYEISAPRGWEKKDTSIGGVKITFLFEPVVAGARFRTNINVVTESMGEDSWDTYYKKNMSTIRQYTQDFKELGEGQEDINGLKARWFKYSHTQSGVAIDAMIYALTKDNIAYVITCTAQGGKLEAYKPQLAEALQSFKF
ncbi:DcrB-related protein [Chitinophaga defluvii]|uniref:DcrB-related protein n=1 Tax=Chitinophaga defluvii TaxID=3163343 RepID=A0ABV2T297_9BACT